MNEDIYFARADMVKNVDVSIGMGKIFGEGFSQ